MSLMLILLVLLVAMALWSAMTTLLLRATIGLAATSVMLAIVMFIMGAKLAAIMELSVCAGLISVVFVSVISLTQRKPFKEYVERRRKRLRRFWPLPLVLAAVGIGLSYVHVPVQIKVNLPSMDGDARVILWSLRQLDLFGQILVLLAGAFGVLVLFKRKSDDND
jgi:NADH-quinone oxidoreductase subunit J